MENKGVLTKVLAIAGTVLAWIPILFTILTSIIGTISYRAFRLDYLMPAELFPAALIGGLLLIWASHRARSQRKLIGWGFGAAAVFLISGQIIAVISGLASGSIEPTGWVWELVVASIVLYSLALIEICIAGILLVRKLFLMNLP